MRRKTRKFPDMVGSIRKRKKDVSFAKRFDKWCKVYCTGSSARLSEPIIPLS